MKRRIPGSTWAEIRTAHASGIGLRELARNMGIPEGTVLARSKREGWTRQIQCGKALGSTATASQMTPADAAAVTLAERGQRHVLRVAGIVEKALPHVQGLEPGAILDRIEDVERLDKLARRTFGIREDQPAGNSVLVNLDLRNVVLANLAPGAEDMRNHQQSENAPDAIAATSVR